MTRTQISDEGGALASMSVKGGLRAFPSFLAWAAHALEADLRKSAARIASDGCIRANKSGLAFKFERLDEGGLGLIGDPRQGERPYCCRDAIGRRWVSPPKRWPGAGK
jgi:hypothetical protein